MKQANTNILVVGKPGTSKTTFLAQLFNIIQAGRSQLSLPDGMPTNIRSINEARKQLDNGENVQSTHSEENNVLQLKVCKSEMVFELEFPDYGGEQVRDIIRDRKITGPWIKMCKDSDIWLLFIRLHDHVEPFDVLRKSIHEIEPAGQREKSIIETIPVNEAIELIELLQILVATRGLGIQNTISSPKLKLVITLWDELQSDDLPSSILTQKYPLLAQYALSNWFKESIEIWGLSAQGFRLDSEENKEKYFDYGPANYAYVIRPDGEKVNDLSLIFI